VCEGRYQVLSLDGKPGSVLPDQTFSPDQKGRPGVWLKHVKGTGVERRLCPEQGNIVDLLWHPHGIQPDARVDTCRLQNPDDGPM